MSGEDTRYLRLRADTLMGMFRRLPPAQRAQALAAFARSTTEHGGDSAQRYLAGAGGDKAALLERVVKTAGELGWGSWRFTGQSAGRLALEVADSPFAAGYGAADAGYGTAETEVCAPIAGMLQAVAALVLEAECEARETECRARGAAQCRFEAIARGKT